MESPPPPDEASLREAALAHLARYAATRAGLARVLDRRIDRWSRAAEAEPEQARALKTLARAIVERLAAVGAVDDAAFAASRARRLTRAGKSRRAAAAHLAAKGVPADLVRAALPEDDEAEFDAALAWARRRRIGPFRAGEADRARELAVLARAGFGRAVAERALDCAPDEAASRLAAATR